MPPMPARWSTNCLSTTPVSTVNVSMTVGQFEALAQSHEDANVISFSPASAAPG